MAKAWVAALALLFASVAAFALDSVDFGAASVGQTKQATYNFTNSGLFTCLLQAVGFGEEYAPTDGAFRVVPPALPTEVAPGQTVSWLLSFAPVAPGAATATLRIRLVCGIFAQTATSALTGVGVGYGVTDLTGLYPPGATDTMPGTAECTCGAEIAALDADMAALSAYLVTQLGPAVSAANAAIARIEGGCADEAAACPGPFPTAGGTKLQALAAASAQVTAAAADVLPRIDPTSPGLQTVLTTGAAAIGPLLQELAAIPGVVASLTPTQRTCLDTYVPEEAIYFLQAVGTVVADPATHPKLRGLLGSSSAGTLDKILEKIGIWAGDIPVLGHLIDDIRALNGAAEDVFGLAGIMFQYELERKLDGIIYGLFGIVIPPNATERELESLLGRITGESIQGRLERMEGSLGAMAEGLGQLGADIAAVDERVREIERVVNENAAELADIEKKICCFVLTMRAYVRQMGLALYGNGAAFEFLVPDLCRGVTEAQCFGMTTTAGGAPTFDAIKPEIRQLEDDMVWVRERIEEILRRLGGGGLVPIDEAPPVIVPPTERPEMEVAEREYFWLAITKKIYVYAEDTFVPTSTADVHEVHVVTPAFDLSGWVDLSELRPGDEVTVEIRVSVDGKERPFTTTTFAGAQDARLVYFDELTGGRSLIVGDDVRILFRQTASADAFGTAIGIGYQFVVESQL